MGRQRRGYTSSGESGMKCSLLSYHFFSFYLHKKQSKDRYKYEMFIIHFVMENYKRHRLLI